MYVLLSRTQGGPGKTVKQDQEEISGNHVQILIYLSVLFVTDLLSPLLVDGLLAGDALYEPHVVQLALRLVLHPLPLLRLGLQTRNDRPQRLHLLPDLKLHSH